MQIIDDILIYLLKISSIFCRKLVFIYAKNVYNLYKMALFRFEFLRSSCIIINIKSFNDFAKLIPAMYTLLKF